MLNFLIGKSECRGFTLVEVLLSAAILSVGLSQIFAILLRSASAVNNLHIRSSASLILEQEVQYLRDKIKSGEKNKDASYSKSIGQNPNFSLAVQLTELIEESGLYRADMNIAWHESGKDMIMRKVLCVKK